MDPHYDILLLEELVIKPSDIELFIIKETVNHPHTVPKQFLLWNKNILATIFDILY